MKSFNPGRGRGGGKPGGGKPGGGRPGGGKPGHGKRSFSKAKPGKSGKPEGKKRFGQAQRADFKMSLPKDDRYKDVNPMSIEERKAAQLEKWRKELGLDEEE
ncbi:MAG: hypothetical protein HY751_09795 [Nitrospinae bacterium]|nr:hypothetical protein [Nitrospinota bacterium]